MDRRHFLLSSLATTAAVGLAPAARAAETRGDIAILRDLLTSLHPGLYRYASPRQTEQRLAALERTWDAAAGLEQRYLALSAFLATIRCGHSYASFFNQSQPVADALFERPTRLPFAFRWIGDEMVVTANHSSAGGRTEVWLPVGSIIRAVDGVPVRDMLRRLLPFARVDGHNDGKARSLLSVTGSNGIEFFDVFHGLVYGAPQGGTFNIHYRAPGTPSDVWADMPALTLAERRSFSPGTTSGDDGVLWQWRMRDDGIAVLTMDGWAVYNSRWDWQAWLGERLDSLAGARGLILDIRQNEGGLDCGDPILARFAAEPIRRSEARRLVRYRRVPDHLNAYLRTWDNGFRDWGDQAQPFDDRYFQLADTPEDDVIAPRWPRLTMPMAVLTSAENSSATFQFAQLARREGLATLIGETTGGNLRGINGGAFFFATLPQSGIEFDLPLIGTFPTRPQHDGGLSPDIVVAPTAADLAAGTDRAMERAVAHILRA